MYKYKWVDTVPGLLFVLVVSSICLWFFIEDYNRTSNTDGMYKTTGTVRGTITMTGGKSDVVVPAVEYYDSTGFINKTSAAKRPDLREGDTVDVYYPPDKPYDPLLLPSAKSNKQDIILILFTGAAVLFSLGMLAHKLFYRKKKHRPQ